jgi:hypothetical protein
MPVATSPSAILPASPVVKMEDRKRPANNNADDLAPPSKRHQVNGSSKSRDDALDMKDEAWVEVSNAGLCSSITTTPTTSPHRQGLEAPFQTRHTIPQTRMEAFDLRYLSLRLSTYREDLPTGSVLMHGLLAAACRALRSSNALQPSAGILSHPILNGRYTTHPLDAIEGIHADCWAPRHFKKMQYTGRCLSTRERSHNWRPALRSSESSMNTTTFI